MSTPIKTNPAYAALAYRRTVLHNTIVYLRRTFVGIDGDPKEKMICEDVIQVDSVVPVDEIDSVIEDLIDEEEELKLAMNKFEFVERTHEPKQRKKRKQKATQSKQKEGESPEQEGSEGDGTEATA